MVTNYFNRFALLGVVLGLLPGTGALAATTTNNLTVTATVGANCIVNTATLDFGAYDPIVANVATARDAQVALEVTCTSATAARITIGQGLFAAVGSTELVPLRQMGAGLSRLAYSLYQEAGRLTVWGNTQLTGEAYTGTGVENTSAVVYGRIPAGQSVPAGAYSDTAIVTITF